MTITDGSKRCPKCERVIPIGGFYRQRAQPDGFAPYCKSCWSQDNAARHARKRAGEVDKRRIQMMQVHHDYFSVITRHQQAYVLGLLASDGNVSSERPRIGFGAQDKDESLVTYVRDELAPGTPIRYWARSNPPLRMARITITSPQMRADLARLETVPRKSKTLQWPEELPTEFVNSFCWVSLTVMVG